MGEVRFVGELTGAEFGYPLGRQLHAAGWGERFQGRRTYTNETVFIHRLDTLVKGFEDDMERARAAVAVARRPEIQACRAIVRLIDFHYERIANEWKDPYELLVSVWEWGESSLRETIDAGDYDAERLAKSVEEGVGAALECLHAAGLVHSDVAPNNILHVVGSWKLADLNRCVPDGDPVIGIPGDARYVLSGAELGKPSLPEMDTHGLAAVAKEIRDT